jgi:hypothetical protein
VHRRTFISTATLAATAPLAVAGDAPGQPAGFRIDCQSHLFCPEILAIMAKRKTDPVLETRGGERWVRMGDWNRRVLPNHSDVQAKLASMDQNAIRMMALSAAGELVHELEELIRRGVVFSGHVKEAAHGRLLLNQHRESPNLSLSCETCRCM